MNKLDLHELTDNIISSIEEGIEEKDWTKPWRVIGGDRPVNPCTNKTYNGINILILRFREARHGYSTPYWAGMRQWNRLGSKVKKGAKHTKIVFYETRVGEREVDGETKNYSYPFAKSLRVWNADQVEGWTPPKKEEIIITDDIYIDSCDKFVEATKISVIWGGNSACFIPSVNEVHMPPREHFLETKTATAIFHVYSTLFHEFGHATGHKDRLDRGFDSSFGTKSYAIEELVAEITSAFLCSQFDITDKTTPREDHLQYMQHWFEIVKADPNVLLRAAKEAAKAVEYLNNAAEENTRQQAS